MWLYLMVSVSVLAGPVKVVKLEVANKERMLAAHRAWLWI